MDSSLIRGFAAGIVGGAAAAYLLARVLSQSSSASTTQPKKAANANISTTSSSHDGNVYETDKAVAEYLLFHFGKPEDILPYSVGPKDALQFAQR